MLYSWPCYGTSQAVQKSEYQCCKTPTLFRIIMPCGDHAFQPPVWLAHADDETGEQYDTETV